MLSVSKLARLAHRGPAAAFPLFDAVVRNGHPLPLSARARLSGSGSHALHLSALGFALQRAVELSYAPTLELADLARRVADAVTQEASSVEPVVPPRHHTGALAVALAGLADAVSLLHGTLDPASAELADLLRDHAELAAQKCVPDTAAFPGDAIDAAIVIWQLAARQEHLGPMTAALVSAAERTLDAAPLSENPACLTILALRPQNSPRGFPPRARRAA